MRTRRIETHYEFCQRQATKKREAYQRLKAAGGPEYQRVLVRERVRQRRMRAAEKAQKVTAPAG